jgi:two-component system phosphate regulon sensor histidine kinase PhoR
MFEKAKFVNEMMLQTFRENISDAPEELLDTRFLDSVIRTEMKIDGHSLEYQFMVLNAKGRPIRATTSLKNYSDKLSIKKNFQTALFPANLFGKKLALVIYFPSKNSILLQEMWLPLLVNLSLVLIIVWALTFMFQTIVTQKKLAELKNDFVSNMTHEFKTPIATISLACQAMEDPDMAKQNSEELVPFVKMINDENKRLGLLVEQILQSAQLDQGNVELRKEKVLLNEILHELVHKAQFRIKNLGGKVSLQTPIELIYIQADKLHLSNVISNLIDNAIKYSDIEPEVKVELTHTSDFAKIIVSDKGLGIKKEHISKIFDKLYRIPTGNLHNVKGFGLGLSYVKVIAKLHNWNVTVKSKVGEGSCFIIEIKK